MRRIYFRRLEQLGIISIGELFHEIKCEIICRAGRRVGISCSRSRSRGFRASERSVILRHAGSPLCNLTRVSCTLVRTQLSFDSLHFFRRRGRAFAVIRIETSLSLFASSGHGSPHLCLELAVSFQIPGRGAAYEAAKNVKLTQIAL